MIRALAVCAIAFLSLLPVHPSRAHEPGLSSVRVSVETAGLRVAWQLDAHLAESLRRSGEAPARLATDTGRVGPERSRWRTAADGDGIWEAWFPRVAHGAKLELVALPTLPHGHRAAVQARFAGEEDRLVLLSAANPVVRVPATP
ncbi:MAG: hypothetical protein QNK05_07965 [Myxococcota bacterium]|nr:hypothetical protein [Myxococcota bacterium]